MNVRGLFPSIGAGGSLIAAAVCALAVFGGVLAFRGDQPGTAEANAGDVVVSGRTARAQTRSPGLVRTVLVAAETAQRVVTAGRPRRPPRAAVRPRRTRTAPSVRPTPSPPAPDSPSPGASVPPATSTPAPSVPAPSVPTPSVPTPGVPSGTVKHVVEQTRSTVQPVVDAVPPPADAPVDHVVDTVEDVAGAVDGVTGALLP